MKSIRKVIAFVIITTVICTPLGSCGKKESTLTTVTLSEVAHSIFYAPMYVAIENGYFLEEGIDLTLVNSSGADNVMTALISGDADVGFMGPEATVYVYEQGASNYAVNFAQLTQRAGNFLVGREADSSFEWKDLAGTTVIGGRKGGMPEMIFEYILKAHGIDPITDLNIIQNIDFGLTAEAFASGTGDYTVEFEPFATSLEESENGCVIDSLGTESGYVPYTCFCVLNSYLDKNQEMLGRFTAAIQKGMDYVNSHTPQEIADIIQPQFKETANSKLVTIIDRYAAQDTWKSDTIFTEDAFELLKDILRDAGELDGNPDYDTLVYTRFSENAAK